MEKKFIVGDVVMYDNKIMVIKEPRDGSHFDLSCPKKRLVYCLVSVDDIKPVSLTFAILEKNGWEHTHDGIYELTDVFLGGDPCDEDNYAMLTLYSDYDMWYIEKNLEFIKGDIKYVHQLQHLFFGLGINHEMEV